MRVEPGTRGFEAELSESAHGGEQATRRRDQLRALVRAHQDLVERRQRLMRNGAPADGEIARDLAELADRIGGLLSTTDREP